MYVFFFVRDQNSHLSVICRSEILLSSYCNMGAVNEFDVTYPED